MFILTDGKNYVMENPMKAGFYLSTTSSLQSKEFTFRQARSLLHNKKKSLSWVKSFHMVNQETGKTETEIPHYSNERVFCGDKKFEFDDSVVKTINNEIESIIGLAGWDIVQLNNYIALLNQGLSYYDSAISDIRHVRLGKRPPAHIMVKIDKIRNDLEEKRRNVKETRNYIDILVTAINQQWSLGKIKSELTKAQYAPYKGRTKYYNMAEDMLRSY